MKFVKSFSILVIITLFTQIVMMVRNMLMANYFGVSAEMDAYNLANVLTVSTMNIVSAAITTVLIPFLSNANTSKEEKESISTFVSVLGVFSLLIVCLFLFFGRPLVKLFTSSYDEKIQVLTFELIIILAISQLFRVYTGIVTAFLQTRSDFVNPKIATLIAGVVSISYFFFTSNPNMYGVTICLGISFIIEALYLKMKQNKVKTNLKISFEISNPTFRELVKNTVPIILSSAAFQLSLVFSNFIASYFGEGYVSILGYGNQIVNIFHSLIILNIVMMLYPNLTRKFNSNLEDAKKSLVNYINITNMLVIPMVFGFLALGNLIVEILFERGNFSSHNTQGVYLMSAILFMAFPFNTIREYIYRSFYCIKDTKTPSRNSILVVFINIFLIITLIPIFKVYAVAIGPVLAAIISLALSYKKLKKKLGVIDKEKRILKSNIGFTVNALLMSLIVIFIKNYLDNYNLMPILELLLLTVIGGITFLLLIYLTQRNFVKNVIKNPFD
jgi:putative peptidoglycan lipid II flippase